MKRRYQMDREKAVRRFESQAAGGDHEVQLHVPLKQIASALQEGVGELMRQAGLELMQLIMEDEVRQLAGECCQRREDEQGYRWGREQGFLVVDGQKVKVDRPRVRSTDGIEYQGQHLIVALGVNNDGVKTVLGLRQGASENTVVVSALLGDLAQRCVDFSEPRLYVLDGARALVKAVREHAGEEALIQRCQLHKRRNVVGYLREEDRQAVEARLAAAYALRSTEEAQQALEQLHRELQELNPSAARSLEEGLDETLTVNRLPLEGWLRRTLSTTNPIESAFSVVETVCRRVKCWQQGDHLERWVGSALWVAEGNFRKVKGYRDLPKLVAALENLRPRPPAAQARAA